jgi:hypothetical protein
MAYYFYFGLKFFEIRRVLISTIIILRFLVEEKVELFNL